MKITILTLFPEMFTGPFDISIIKKAKEKQFVTIVTKNIRDFGIGTHKQVDDTPYGGGIGMVMRVDVLKNALDAVRENLPKEQEKVLLLSARGDTFTQERAKTLSALTHLILICGHYEGVDDRISEYIDGEVSIGDFVTTGGEIPAMLITDAIVRLIPGVLKDGVTENESFSLNDATSALLEYPQFTNPRSFNGRDVPEVLLSGNHKHIETWRMEQARQITTKKRPDLKK
jgi:tRNA (guanine37-N1)-methyltransferase